VDVVDPRGPKLLSTITPGDQWPDNHHSSVLDESRSLLIVNEEILEPELAAASDGWGTQQIYDISDPLAPVIVAEVATPNSTTGTDPGGVDGYYSAHHTTLAGSMAVTSWYSDGVRLVDLTDPSAPTEVGSFVPPGSPDPYGYWIAPDGSTAFPMVWGVDVQKETIYLSDINSGLWVVRIGTESTTATRTLPAPG